MVVIVICLLTAKKSTCLKRFIKTSTFQIIFVYEAYFDYVETGSFIYDFSVDYDAIDESDILNIQKNLMVKNNVK